MKVSYVTGSPVPEKSGYGKYALTVLRELKSTPGLQVKEIRSHVPVDFPYRNVLLDFSVTPVKTLVSARGAITHASSQGLAFLGLLGVRPFVVTAYDAIPFALGEERKSPAKQAIIRLMAAGLNQADAIITISEFSRRELSRLVGLDRRRIFVAYPGVDRAVFRPGREKRDLNTVLYVGSEQPRKNTGVLLEAFAMAKRRRPGLKLLKVGVPQWRTGRGDFLAKARELGVQDSISFVEGVSEGRLASIYRSAGVLVFPSTYEGFGLPPLEAMACGLPVVCSSAASLPEVVGNAAITHKPADADAFAAGILEVLCDKRAWSRRSKAGVERAKRFTWKRAAEETVKVYKSLE